MKLRFCAFFGARLVFSRRFQPGDFVATASARMPERI